MFKKFAISMLLLLLAACTPTTQTPFVPPAQNPIVATSPSPMLTEAPLVIPPYPVPAGGFAFALPQTYYVDPLVAPMKDNWQDPRSILLAAANYTSYGPFIRLGGGPLTPPLTAASMLDYLRQDRAEFGYVLSEDQPIRSESGLFGSVFTYTFPIMDASGAAQVMLFASESQYVYLMAAAPQERWEQLSIDLMGVVDSLTFIPIVPATPVVADLAFLPPDGKEPQSYNLGFTALSLPDDLVADVPPSLATRPVELKGIFSLPEGAGPFPVALILHGRDKTICESHFIQVVSPSVGTWFCPPGMREVRYDVGFAALANALAEEGIAAFSINVNEGYLVPNEFFEIFNALENPLDLQFVPLIAQEHLEALALANKGESQAFGADLTGKLDLTNIVLIGHSRGGENALALARELDGAAGLLMVAPANKSLFTVPPDMPFAVLTPSCDGDLTDWQGQAFFESAVQDPSRNQPGFSAMLGFANHNYFNGLLEMKDDSARKLDNEACTLSENILPQGEAQTFLLNFTTAFARAILLPDLGQPFPPFDPTAPVVYDRYGVPVLENLLLPTQQRAVLWGPNGLRAPGILVSRIRLESMDCAMGEFCHPTLAPKEVVLPGNPAVSHLAWDTPDAALQFTFSPEPFNASGYDHLSARLVLDPTDTRNLQTQTELVIELTDIEENVGRVVLQTPVLFHTEPSLRYGWSGIPIQLSSLRIPLDEFKGVDPAAITNLTLLFPAESGALYLADVEFLRDRSVE